MRLYITTSSCIQNVVSFFEMAESQVPNPDAMPGVTGTGDAVPVDTQQPDEAKAVVFYKSDDTVKLADVAVLYEKVNDVELVAVEDRDDMLVLLGTMINQYIDGQGASIIVLDPSLTIPKRYELKVTVVGNPPTKSKSGRSGSRSRGKKKVVNVPVETNPEADQDVRSALNSPDGNADVSDGSIGEMPEFQPDMEEIKKNNVSC